jgi:hypothetical protein
VVRCVLMRCRCIVVWYADSCCEAMRYVPLRCCASRFVGMLCCVRCCCVCCEQYHSPSCAWALHAWSAQCRPRADTLGRPRNMAKLVCLYVCTCGSSRELEIRKDGRDKDGKATERHTPKGLATHNRNTVCCLQPTLHTRPSLTRFAMPFC